ncbi:related to cell cycle checkpoint protein RAD17 [Melanopsichium pennsylvanicum]|uniref:Related to cell cycle checkpoint protein RAD17 n=2 Tax=Melanopsichium pennsylvanicum TaxID=63383 RepID=A0AAJ4XJT2_9BASI|nr:related to cell cycle checkpoint protein RAD17 [Melanopsichium pennsylvanicum 4]SNX83292.1 related to cell cycle checkpoint protein RAD17 [Melanopsichium pennsylvanicum]
MPPKQTRSFSRSLSYNSITSNPSSSKTKLKQNKLDFSFHSVSSSARPFGSRPLSSTPSFGLPTTAAPPAPTASPAPPSAIPLPALDKGKQKQQNSHDILAEKLESEDNFQDAASLWSERLAPTNAQELAVHPKKVAQVRGWLTEAFSSQPASVTYHKVLALTGPAGAAKSATLRALASPSDLDFDILEWQNDQPTFDPSAPASSFIERFTDFLSKAAKFPTLHFQASDNNASSSLHTLDATHDIKPNRLILLEDLPNLHHLQTKLLFQASIEQYIQQSTQLTARGFPNVPIVLIVTESTPREDEDRWAGDSSTNTWRERIASIIDTRTALGEIIRKNPAYTEIRFNPVAPTIIIKGLKRAIEKAPSTASENVNPKALHELLQAIAEDSSGDLRAAVNCLHFMGANSKQFDIAARSKVGKKGEDGTKAMRRLMPLVSGRESSLALFHALGKVLYNKREGDSSDQGTPVKGIMNGDADSDPDDDDTDQMQLKQRLQKAMCSIVQPHPTDACLSQSTQYMSHLERRPPRIAVDQLWADLPVDSVVFQMYLHQNFPQFCTQVEQCESILEGFSSADGLSTLHESYRHSSLLAYYSFLIVTRSTLLHLPSPVPRSGQKLGKATWWDVQKKLRSMLLDLEDAKNVEHRGSQRLVRDDATGSRFKRTKFNNPSFDPTEIEKEGRTDAGLGDESHSILFRSNPVTLLTEVLPLLAKIRPAGTDNKVHEMARMRFEYAGVADMASRQLDEHETGADDNEEDVSLNPAAARQKQDQKLGKRKESIKKEPEEREEQLFLSDDDIAEF